ncbi:NifU family protein [Candidatus Similichlamydia epinepheli]|uniref:NifU family protein n=1 Tax=Candidatus Similichlamydia epinepheli TaxID=1903953 RepID=UPI000D386660|nr:NifU family protein [Candidatus Similichlamydia epinepheli]
MLERSIWSLYCKKAKKLIRDKPLFWLDIEEDRETLLVVGHGGTYTQGTTIRLSLLVSEKNGRVEQASYSCFGNDRFLLMCESATTFCLKKTYRQLEIMTGEVILRHFYSTFRKEVAASLAPFINTFLDAVTQACECCSHLPAEPTSPFTTHFNESNLIENWIELTSEERRRLLEEALDKHVRPFLLLDSGNIKILDIDPPLSIKLAYEGACIACPAAHGSTLLSIRNILQKTIHPSLEIVVDEKTISPVHPLSNCE